MRKKKKRHEEHADESWLLPYSDLLTLLLALFIVMFAISEVDNQKLQLISEQFNAIFSGGSGPIEQSGTTPVVTPPEGSPAIDPYTVEDHQLAEIKKSIEAAIEKSGYADKVELFLNKDGLQISIRDVMLFNSGEAEILPNVSSLLLEMSKMLNTMDNRIIVVGHTDNVPIQSGKFRSNWDLSVIRAINVMNFLVDQGNLSPKRFSVQGYGEYAPKYDNSTAEGRAGNRRVEVLLIRDYPLGK